MDHLDLIISHVAVAVSAWIARSAYEKYKATESERVLKAAQKAIERRIALKSKPRDPAALVHEAQEAALVQLIKDEAAGLK